MRLASEQAEQQEERKERASEAQVHRRGVLINERSLQSVHEVCERSRTNKEDTVANKGSLKSQGTLLEASEALTISRLIVTREERQI
jgi:hypothetical protein